MTAKSNYRPRIVDDILEKKLEGCGAVLVEGPKWCGKTTTAEHHAKSVLYMDDPARLTDNVRMAEIEPSRLLDGECPRLLVVVPFFEQKNSKS